MGYYTYYTLQVELQDKNVTPDQFEFLSKDPIAGDIRACDLMNGGNGEDMNWYSADEDMIAYSKKHPAFVFILDGEGEDRGDMWRAFYSGGKYYVWTAPVPDPPLYEDVKHYMKTKNKAE